MAHLLVFFRGGAMTSEAARRLKQIMLAIDQMVCVAESLTGGNIQSEITSVGGASNYFAGGITTYNIDQKVALLGVDRKHAAAVNCVSRQVAEEMADGVRKLFGSFVSVSATGYAEPSPANKVPTPFAFYAINIGGWVSSDRIEAGDRTRVAVQKYIAEQVVQKLINAFDRLTRIDKAPDGLESIQHKLRRQFA